MAAPVPVQDALKAFEERGDDVLVITERKPAQGKTWRTGVGYISMQYVINANEPPRNCTFYATDVLIASTLPDPSKKKKNPGDREEKSVSLAYSYNNSNSLGKLMERIQIARDNQIAKLMAKGELSTWQNKTKISMIKTNHGVDEATPADLRGTPYKDPTNKEKVDKRGYLHVDFTTYGDEMNIQKRGCVKSCVQDFRTGSCGKNGIFRYALALSDDKKPINETNAFRFLTGGSTIVELYVTVNSTSKSQYGISTRQEATILIVDPKIYNMGIQPVNNNHLAERIAAARAKVASQSESELLANDEETCDNDQQEMDDAINNV